MSSAARANSPTNAAGSFPPRGKARWTFEDDPDHPAFRLVADDESCAVYKSLLQRREDTTRHERRCQAILKCSRVMLFGDWDPPRDSRGRGPRWFHYYRRVLREDVVNGRLTPHDAALAREFLDVTGT